MKRILLAIIAVASILLVSGCGKKNPYDGTIWIKSFRSTNGGSDWTHVLKFDGNKVSYFLGDMNGNYQSGMSEGTCSVKGNEITFEPFRNNVSILEDVFTGATINGSTLYLHSYWVNKDGVKKENTDEVLVKK